MGEDNKKSLVEAQKVLDNIVVPGLKDVHGLCSVTRTVCGECQDFKILCKLPLDASRLKPRRSTPSLCSAGAMCETLGMCLEGPAVEARPLELTLEAACRVRGWPWDKGDSP